jgi:hypothetical protein
MKPLFRVAALLALLIAVQLIVFPSAQQAPTSSAPPVLPTPVVIAKGGTGQITQTAAFDALSPLTTQGDLIYRNGSNNVRLAAGTSGQFLKTLGSGANPAWAAAPAYSAQLVAGGATGLNPADATTYYVGIFPNFTASTVDNGAAGYLVPTASTLKAVYGRVLVSGTLGSNDGATSQSTVVVRKNTSTDIATVTSTLQLTAATDDFNNNGLSVAVSAGDILYVKLTTGTWVTNPTATFYIVTLYFEVP